MDEKIDEAARGFPGVKGDKVERELPELGTPTQQILSRMNRMKAQETDILNKKYVSGQVYSNDAAHEKLLNEAYSLFSLTNPLHPETFPSIKKFEAEVIRMTCSMMNGDENTCGGMTSGGTESIIMAIKTYRDWAKEVKGITKPEVVVPVTAHAAFNKGCHYFGCKLVEVPVVADTQMVDPKILERHITKNTICIVGSAPCYSVGTVDPIPELAQLALKYNIGLHVDCCLGGFFVPFAKRLGAKIPAFDFSVEGVTSMSADTHKYGLAVKGSSVLMFRSKEYRKYMYFLCPNWTGGFYASPSLAGSRAGGLIASCWAALMHIGDEGYMENTKKMLTTANAIRDAIRKHPHIDVLGDSHAMVVSMKSDKFNIYHLVDSMGTRGWKINAVQNPSGAHICITMRTAGLENEFLEKLFESVEDVMANPKKYRDTGAMYGAAVWVPPKELSKMMVGLLDSWTDVERGTDEEKEE